LMPWPVSNISPFTVVNWIRYVTYIDT
jgi:hypothetical protein